MKVLQRIVFGASCVLFSLSFFNCDDEPVATPGPCDSTLLVNTLPLNEDFAALGDVDEVQYRADVNDNTMEIELYDDAGQSLGVATDAQMVDAGTFDIGTYVQSYEGLSFISKGELLDADRHTVNFELRRDNAPSFFVQASFRDDRCGPERERALHVCAPQLLGDDARILPSCGLSNDSRLAKGQRPLLTRLRLMTQGLIDGRDGTTVSETETISLFDVVLDEELRNRADIDLFLENSGFNTLAQTEAHKRLLTISADPTWSRVLTQHFSECLQEGFSQETASANQNESALTVSSNVKESAVTDGNNAYRDPLLFDTDPPDGVDADGNPVAAPSSKDNKKKVKGDPHLVTFDELGYDFQAAGDFVLAKRTGVLPFELQARFAPLNAATTHIICSAVTWMVAGAIRLPAGEVVNFSIGDNGVFRVTHNGAPIDDDFTSAGVTMVRARRNIDFFFDDGTFININSSFYLLSVSTRLPEPRVDENVYEGLLGNADGQRENDLVGVGDVLIPPPATNDALRDSLRVRWAVTETNSLFDYEAGRGPNDFADPQRPSVVTLPGDIPPDSRDELRAECLQLGLTGADLPNCMLDVYCQPVGLDRNPSPGQASATGDTQSRPSGVLLEGDAQIETLSPVTDFTELVESDVCSEQQPFVAGLFEEGKHTLAADLLVDEQPDSQGEVTLQSGRVVDSFLLTLRPHAQDSESVQGSMRFASDVIGFVRSASAIEQTHSIFVDEGIAIVGQSLGTNAGDSLTLSNDRRTVEFDFTTTSEGPLLFRVLVDGGAS